MCVLYKYICVYCINLYVRILLIYMCLLYSVVYCQCVCVHAPVFAPLFENLCPCVCVRACVRVCVCGSVCVSNLVWRARISRIILVRWTGHGCASSRVMTTKTERSTISTLDWSWLCIQQSYDYEDQT